MGPGVFRVLGVCCATCVCCVRCVSCVDCEVTYVSCVPDVLLCGLRSLRVLCMLGGLFVVCSVPPLIHVRTADKLRTKQESFFAARACHAVLQEV